MKDSIFRPFKDAYVSVKIDDSKVLNKRLEGPKRIDELFNLQKEVANRIIDWVKLKIKYQNSDFEENIPVPFLIIDGSKCIGKKTIVRLCFKYLNCGLVEYDYDINNEIYNKLLETLTISNIEKLLFGKDTTKGIIIKNYNNILSQEKKRKLVKFLIKNNKNCFPIIFITNQCKKINDLSRSKIFKDSKIILNKLEIEELIYFANEICKKNEINISQDLIKKICEDCNYNINDLTNQLIILKDPNNKKIELEEFKNNLENNFKKDLFLNNISKVKYILDDTKTLKEKLNQTNLCINNYFYDNYITDNSSIETISKISDSFSLYDIFKENVFKNNNWGMLCYVNVFGSIIPSMYMDKNVNIKESNLHKDYERVKKFGCGYSVDEVVYILKNIINKSDINNLSISQYKLKKAISILIEKDKKYKYLKEYKI